MDVFVIRRDQSESLRQQAFKNYNYNCDVLPLWISTNSSIVEINQSEGKDYILVPTKTRAIFFDFHFERKEIYWVEEEGDDFGFWSTRIYRTGLRFINTTMDVGAMWGPEPQLLAELGTCGGLTLDWLHSHMYWVLRDSGHIIQAELDGSHRRVVYYTEVDITNIVVDPVRRYLFWTERVKTKNATLHYTVDIRASDLSGGNVHTIISSIEPGLQRSIALDVTERRLYFIERSTVLSMCDYDGENKVVVRTIIPQTSVFTVSNKQLFWATLGGEVSTVLKHGGGEAIFSVKLTVCKFCTQSEKELMFGPSTYLRVLDGRMQPISETDHHFFHDCLFNFTSFTEICPCPFGYRTVNRTQSCEEEGFFLVSFYSTIQGVCMKGKTMPLLFKRRTKFNHLDFHYTRGLLFWFDPSDNKIYKSSVLNPSAKSTVALMVKGTAGLAVDWIYDHLYWTNNNRNGGCIEVCKLDGSLRMTFVPRSMANYLVSIVVHPAAGMMYVANWTQGSIEVMGMDGTPIQRLAGGLKKPQSLTLDLHSQEVQIYWFEIIYKREWPSTVIRACYLENGGSCRVVFESQPGLQLSSLTVFLNKIFWLDEININYIRTNQQYRPRKLRMVGKHSEPYSLKTFASRVQPLTPNHCWAACRGLCVPVPQNLGQLNTRCIGRAKIRPYKMGYSSIGL